MAKTTADELIKEYAPLIAKIDGTKRKKRVLSMIRKFKPTKDEMKAVTKILTTDRWKDPFWALQEIRKTNVPRILSVTLELRDNRVIDGLNNAAKAGNTTPEELATDALIQYLTERSYIPRNVAEQLETLKFVEEALGTEPAK